ncbi:hypothetical protein C6503_03510 [Candidatus Poribacteria bacterium]|nr:MAG: hypothetical protein C6503_03510 [Candidatus Poribacteria bacterium]
MNYEDAQWLINLCAEPYLKTRHKALQSQLAQFILNYDLDTYDPEDVRERISSFQFRLRIMEIRRRLTSKLYEDEHGGLSYELDKAIAAARQVLIEATEDPRLQFTTSR